MAKTLHKDKLLKIVLLMCLVIAVSVTVAVLVAKKAEETGIAVHESLWKTILDGAKTDKYDMYAIYASRILAVTHPEVYLQGDEIFLNHITSHDGYQKEYLIKDVHDNYFNAQDMVGPPFSFGDVNFENYTTVFFTETYPENYPLFSYLDRRLLPIASTLKLWENKITQLELGEQFYFSLVENSGSAVGLYIIYCDNEETYVCNGGELTWMRNLAKTDTVAGNPILIFNEENVWYPLMGRDDTSEDLALDNVVRKYCTDNQTPQLTEFEEHRIKTLKQVTGLDNKNQILMATIAAAHTDGTQKGRIGIVTYSEFSAAWDNLGIPWYANELFQEIYKRANYLSPITAYLAWISQKQTGEAKISAITNEYLKHTRTPGYSYAWGETWSSGLVGQAIDECYRTRAGHCVWQAASIAAVLDAINVSNYTIGGYYVSSQIIGHSWLYLPEYDLTVSNGTIYSHGTVLTYPSINAVNSIDHGGKWANTVLNYCIGTLSSQESINLLNYLKSVHKDNIEGFNGLSVVPYPELISDLAQEYWMSIQLP
jgi:hypothetical protein